MPDQDRNPRPERDASGGDALALGNATEAKGPLRLVVMDTEDLAILSANLQDTQISVGEIAFLPEQKRFVLAGKRFDWANAAAGRCERCATGLHFERVLRVARHGFTQDDASRVLNLLAIEFEPTDAPAGRVRLAFSGGATIRLEVECLEAQMRDLGTRWPCDCKPDHPIDATA